MSTVKISPGNTKMGAIPSVSLPSIRTCRVCGCNQKCYAAKLERIRPSVAASYLHNLQVLEDDPNTYWREVEAHIMLSRFFRFHVSGDIPDLAYFYRMLEVAKRNPHCQILCFTKRFELINKYILDKREQYILPGNLHIIFSGWPGLEMKNPFQFPEAHVRFKNGGTPFTEAKADAKFCPGNCVDCAVTNTGCWTLKKGEQIVFDEH